MGSDPVDFLKAILEIYSPSGLERDLARYLERRMNGFGLRARMDEVGNVIGEVGEGAPTLLLCGHMDTVTGFLNVRVKEGKIFGRGAVDAKSSMAAMILAASALVDEDLGGKAIVACVVDEEGRSAGMRNLISKGLDVKYAIFGEPSYCRHIVVGYRGSVTFVVECESPRTHVAISPYHANVIERSLALWEKAREGLLLEGESLFRSMNPYLLTIRGQAGRTLFRRPWCDMIVNVRFPPGLTVADVRKRLDEIIDRFRASNPDLAVDVRTIDSCEAIMSRKSSLVVRALIRAVRRVMGVKPRITVKTGSSDMNLLAGTPVHAVSFGPGDPHLEHTRLESVDIEEYTRSIEIYKEAIRELIGLGRGRHGRG